MIYPPSATVTSLEVTLPPERDHPSSGLQGSCEICLFHR